MTVPRALAAQPVLRTGRLTLSQLGPEHLDPVMAGLADEEAMRLTGTRASFTREQVLAHLSGLPGADDRADFAITGPDGAYLGEVVLNELEEDDRSMNYRIALAGPGGAAQRARPPRTSGAAGPPPSGTGLWRPPCRVTGPGSGDGWIR